jgi:hypothetical protein
LVVGPHALIHIQYPAQRWTSFQGIGPSPSARFGHAMACDGTRVFVLGGKLSPGAQVDDAKPIHVLDTSMYFLFVVSFEEPSSLKQSSSFTRNPTPTLSSIMKRPPNLRRGYPRVTRPRVNHNSRHCLRQTRMSTQNIVLLLFKKPLPENWTIPPLCGLLAIIPLIRMASHRYSLV